MQTESDEDDCGGPEPARIPDTNLHLQSKNYENLDPEASDGPDVDWQAPVTDSGPETEHSNSGWTETMAAESSVNTLKNKLKRPSGSRLLKNKCFRLKSKVKIQDEKAFSCGVCSHRFRQKQNLKTHMRVHTGEKPFHCDVCGKRFRHHSSFKTHCRIHTGEQFTQQQNLKKHTQVHTSKKPARNLKRHMRVHS